MNIERFIVIVTGCVCSLQAQTNEPTVQTGDKSTISWSITTAVLSEYLAKPGFNLYDKPVSQNEISVSYRGAYFGTWFSQGLESSSSFKYDQESQTFVGYKRPIGWFTFDGNVRYDALKELFASKDDLWMADLRMDVSKMPILQPYVATRHFQAIDGGHPTSGWFIWFGARRVQNLGFKFTEAGDLMAMLDASLAYSDGALSRDSGWVYGRFGVLVNVPITKAFSISPQVLTQLPLDEQGTGRKPYTDGKVSIVWGISASLRF